MTSHDNIKIRVVVLEFKWLIFTGGLIPSTKRRDLETDTEFGIITIYHNIIFVDFLALNLFFNVDVGNGAVEDCLRFLVSKKNSIQKNITASISASCSGRLVSMFPAKKLLANDQVIELSQQSGQPWPMWFFFAGLKGSCLWKVTAICQYGVCLCFKIV